MDKTTKTRSQRTACRRCHARKVRCDAAHGQPCSGCRYAGMPCIAHEKRRRNRGPPKPTALATLLPNTAAATPSRTGGVVAATEGTMPVVAASRGNWSESLRPPTREAPYSVADEQDSEVSRVAAALSSLQDAPWLATGPEVGNSSIRNDRTSSHASHASHSSHSSKSSTSSTIQVNHASVDSDTDDASAAPADVKRHLVEMLSQEDIEDRVMQRGVRIVYVGQEYSNIHYLIRQRARHAPPSVHHFPSNQISRRYTSHELDRIPRKAFALPPAAVVDELLEAYFRHVHPGFPVLDEAVFMSQYRGRDPHNPPSLLVLQAVLMVGAHVCPHRPDRMALKTSFFRRAKMLFDARFEWNRDVVVQAALLLTWHSEGVEDIGANSYFWVGVAARTALGLGMHRDARASTLVAQDQRLWRRLWWILVQFDVIVSLSYGRPPAVRLDESDVPELRPEDMETTPMTTTTSGSEGEDNVVRRTPIDSDFMIHQTRLCCIIAYALRERFGLQVSPDRRRAALLEADQRLAQWMANLPPSLRYHLLGPPGGGHASTPTPPWVAILHLTYNNFLILLHRPPPPQPGTSIAASVTSQDDMGICSSAAMSMVHLLEGVAARDGLRHLNVFAVDAVFTALIQLSAEIRVTNPVLAAHAMRRFDVAVDVLRYLAAYWLNGEIILRLFEDSSERLRTQLSIGKSSSVATTVETVSTPEEVDLHQTVSGPHQHMDVLQALMLSPVTTLQQHLASLNEQLDWTNLYWENSGFASLSPFAEMRMYP